ncbi:hypothetical protein SPRG_04969 [Saprolegnia parasitica CBS 223.65]|uniref:Uncharacterized protein n=2 Tax=Saprolegnia parasitica (strain CBS 223.65) TaxID=695850 RepID=A0A067CHB7_SAPPC|nr:hypothetical protein SPRG_04969 [Saprolegnia parasitica CBS 223.65]KDO29903.1 hypothetical protein SPRG_04969 [Saprolegnia parasitica CBS 223.65]|eukprot:XP_012199497.1 hypothetical protein SPRG_04969 [Saprolegnia parasitica CBS 223.65]
MDNVLVVAEELYLLNQRFTLARVQRVWEMYRRYVNPHVTDGGYALTLDEVLFVLEIPVDDDEVEVRAFFERMKERSATEARDAMDMLEFLVAFTLLSRGTLLAKAHFLFALFDFDVEDEMDQEELSLLMTLAMSGLHKLGLVEDVPAFDAITQMSADGFVRHGVAAGAKMNFNQFLNWATFDADPQSLLQRFTCALRLHHLVHGLSRLAHRQVEPYYRYQLALQTPLPHLDAIRVLCGPVVGKRQVSDTTIDVLYEFSTAATVTFYAFDDDDVVDAHRPPTDTASRRRRLAESHVLTVMGREPVLVTFSALTPGATYVVGLTGVAIGDANTRTARVMTRPSTDHTLCITALNHVGPTLLPSHDALSVATASELSAATTSPRLVIHWHFGTFSPEMVLHAVALLDLDNATSVQSTRDAIQSHCRQAWAPLDGVATTASNLVVTASKDALYSAFDASQMAQLQTLPQASRAWLEACVQAMWARYVTALQPPTSLSADDIALYRDGPLLLLHLPQTPTSAETLGHLLRDTASSVCVVLTTAPLLPLEEAPLEMASTRRYLDALSLWRLHDTARQIVLLAPTHGAGATSTVHITGTPYSFQQLLCGALRQRRPLMPLVDVYPTYAVGTMFTVEHAACHWETQFGQLDVRVTTTADVVPQNIATARWVAPPRIVVGPVVGLVTARSAQLLIELDDDAVVVGEATDVVTETRYVCRQRLYRAEPAVLTFDNLQPQRRYRGLLGCDALIYVQTPQERAPSLHVTWVGGDDAFGNRAFQPVQSFWPDYRENMTSWPATDIVVLLHRTSLSLESIRAAMAHWRGAPTAAESVVKQLFRAAFLTQWTAQDNAAVLAHGSHWFLGTGYDWSAVNEPISRDVVVWARQVAFQYQHHGLWPTLDPLRRYGYHCQDGIGFLHIDVLEHRLATDDIYLCNTPELLSPTQWQLVESVLVQSTGICCTVISCSTPIVWHGHRHDVPSRYLGLEWVLYPAEQTRLLSLVFSWKAAVPGRDLLFVCAGPRSATTTLVHEGVSLTQIVVGPVACVVDDLPTPPDANGALCDGTMAFAHNFGASPEYTSTILTPHATQARWRLHRNMLAQPNAKILVGPVLGKLTATSVRILIEVDRDVKTCVCVCTKLHATDRITASSALCAYTPLAFSLVELAPATEYIVTFEGIAPASVVTRFTTPSTTPYAFSVLTVHDTNWHTVLQRSADTSASSSWADILRSRSINATEAAATAHTNGDVLGVDGAKNLWQRVDLDHTSAPLRKPIVLVHCGGHVNLRVAFSDAELAAIITRLVAMDEAHWVSVLPELRHAMQEAYRVQWNMPPFRDALRNCSNLMLFDETDLFFRLSVIEGRLDDTVDAAKAARVLQLLRDTAYHVWLLYANQLATDVNVQESLASTRTATFASFGHCTLIVLNQHATPKEAATAAPVAKPSGIDISKVTQANNLLPPGAWLTLDDALLYSKQGCKVLLVVVAFDALEVALNPLYLVGVNRLFEKLFEWKNQVPGADRELHLVTLGPALTTYVITDQRSQGVCRLQQLASISTPTRASSTPLYPPSGAITKRFLYAKQGTDAADASRSFVSFAYFSDLDRVEGHMQPVIEPYNVPCKALLGPVLGRLRVVQDSDTDRYSVTATLLLEVNAARAITCIVLDILSGDERRVTLELAAYTPSVFLLSTLDVDRRYTYRFDGLDDETRGGTFHTPSEHTSVLNIVAVSSNLIQFRDPAVVNTWQLLLQRLCVPWHGLDVLLHLGGQVPLQEAAIECTHWLQDECDRRPMDAVSQVAAELRPRLRRRFQQEYWAAWNVPHFRTVLACISNWMVRAQADVATTYGRSPDLLLKEGVSPRTIEILGYIHEIAMEVWRAYQGALGWGPDDDADADEPPAATIAETPATTAPMLPLYYALRFEHIGVFVFDMRSTRAGDVISCNGRLSTPLPPTTRPTISEAQWMAFESLLRKKSVRALILVMELPLLLTTPKNAPPTVADPSLYSALDLQAHWVGCPVQLDQLLSLLFKWKEKIDGRDVAVLSGNMGFGLETTIKDKNSNFELHNYTTGPVTSAVQPFPFVDRGAFEKRFEFEQRFVSPLPNYVLLEVTLTSQIVDASLTMTRASSIGDVLHSANAHVLHAPTRLLRRPPWWRRYCLQNERAFWTTIVVNSVSSQSVLATYLADDKGYLNATKRWYAKYNFVDTTRLADLQSSSTSPETLLATLHDVAKDMWATFPPAIKETVAVLSDVFVVDLALEELQLDLSGPIDVERFRAICTGLAKGACALKAAATLAAEDAAIAYEADRVAKLELQRTLEAATDKAASDAAADAVAMAALQKTNLLEYAQEMNKREKDRLEKEAADKAAAKAAKRAAREAEKLYHHDEDVALHKEKKALAALKGRIEAHYASLGQTPEYEAMEIEYGRRTREVHGRQQRRDESKARDAKTKTKAETKAST